jgi:sterol desaturase/sphingolipid hydroxylase (fatty acid hydroxylase superfamily)
MDFVIGVFANIAITGIPIIALLFLEKQNPFYKRKNSFYENLDHISYVLVGYFFLTYIIGSTLNIFFNTIIIYTGKLTTLSSHINLLPWFGQFLIVLFVMDFFIYLRHRFTHQYMWRFHIIHHSPNLLNLWVKFRIHPFDLFVAIFFATWATAFLEIDILIIGSAALAITAIDLLNHTNINLSWPKPFNYIFSSPNFHKWHHALDTKALNRNYVIVFPFIDLLFGSYYMPSRQPPEQLGIFLHDTKQPVPTGYLNQFFYSFKHER